MEWKFCTECLSLSNCIFFVPNRKELLNVFVTQKPLSFKPKADIYREGFPAEGVFILCRGSVKLTTTTSTGAQRIAGLINAGELFGLDALLAQRVRVFTATARTFSLGFFVERKQFCRIVRSQEDLLWRLVMALNRELHDSEQLRLTISGDRVRKRLYDTILCLGESQCAMNREPRVVSLKQTELSELLGIPAETVSRELKKLRDKGLIEYKQGTLIIRSRLQRTA